MTEPPALDRFSWKILSSTSRFFPTESVIDFKKTPLPEGFQIEVTWEELEQFRLTLPNSTFLENPRGTLKGDFRHPGKLEDFQLVVTLCPVPGPKGQSLLFGVLSSGGRIEGGGTGVWVAEGPPNVSTQE